MSNFYESENLFRMKNAAKIREKIVLSMAVRAFTCLGSGWVGDYLFFVCCYMKPLV